MKPIFTEDDFYSLNMIQEFLGSPVTDKSVQCRAAAFMANEKINKLIESCPVVYGGDPKRNYKLWTEVKIGGDTHKARLALIEELKTEECKHEPDSFITQLGGRMVSPFHTTCKKCGVELVAEWKEKK